MSDGEANVDAFLSVHVYSYLLELEKAPDGIDFEGKAYQVAENIKRDISRGFSRIQR